MLSRVADRIYWMSRQIERAENMARILGVTSNMVLFGTRETREQNLLAPLTITDCAELSSMRLRLTSMKRATFSARST